jgi:ABC-type Fe3+/spermidine/putrescine transport system ATPase subunit
LPDLSLNQKIQLVIRPEKIKFIESSNVLPVALKGVVEERIYIGEIIRYRIRISKEQLLDLNQQISYGVTAFDKGDHVRIGWGLEDSKIL